jgi:endoglycosylceramidase
MRKDKLKRRKRRRFFWTLFLVLILVMVSRSCLYRTDTKRHFIRDEQGRALVLRGFNVNGDAKGDSLRVGRITREEYLRMSRDWGFNFARFLVFWQAIEPEHGMVDTAYLERVRERLDWCREAGLSVVLDMHQDLYTWRFGGDGAPEWAIRDEGADFEMQQPWEKNYVQPAVVASIRNFWMPERGHGELQDHYIRSFMALAESLGDHPAVIGYDLYNEPVLATLEFISFEDRYLQPFYQRLVDSLRRVDTESWIFYEPMALGPNQGFRSGLNPLNDPRKGEARLAYFPHIYTLDLDLSGKYIGFPLFTSAWAAKRKREARRHRAPLLIGEFGLDNTQPRALDYMEAVMRMNEKTGSGWAYWDYGMGGS